MHEAPTPTCAPPCGGAYRKLIGAGQGRRRAPAGQVRSVSGYQPGLARFPDDPRAYVEGPHSLNKLKDAAKRRGASETTTAEVKAAAKRAKETPLPSAAMLFEGGS